MHTNTSKSPIWTDAVSNSQGVVSVYKGEVPELTSVRIHSMSIGRDGPSMTLIFDLASFPSDPPEKWMKQRSDTVQIELLFGGLVDIAVSKFTRNPICDLVISPGSPLEFEVESDSISVHGACDFVQLSRMSAYRGGDV
jgi:hypothetical protein